MTQFFTLRTPQRIRIKYDEKKLACYVEKRRKGKRGDIVDIVVEIRPEFETP